jgi:class 3 adenylate cyclase
MDVPEVRYARSGGLRIAYEVFGTGPVDFVYGRTAISHLELVWEEPTVAAYFRELATASRMILWDKRGVGLSDRTVGTPTLEDRMDDVRAVMDAAKSQRAVIFGASDTAAMAILFAATYPERTLGLILVDPIVRGAWASDFPFAPTREQVEESIQLSDEDWGTPAHIDRLLSTQAPSRLSDADFKRWYGRVIRFGSSPSAAASLARMNLEIDVRAALPAVHVPTLILKCAGARAIRGENSDYVASHVAGAQLATIPGPDHFLWANPEARAFSLRAKQAFLMSLPSGSPDEDRVLKTVVFADIVGSTQMASRIGDHGWKEILDSFLSTSKAEVTRFRGHMVKTLGDGFLASFDGPTRAVRFAQSVRELARQRGFELRAGVHTGECLVEDNDVVGIAVHLASRICDSAHGGEVVTSRTVRDLSVGSEVRFEPRGSQQFKGVEGAWETFLALSREP